MRAIVDFVQQQFRRTEWNCAMNTDVGLGGRFVDGLIHNCAEAKIGEKSIVGRGDENVFLSIVNLGWGMIIV